MNARKRGKTRFAFGLLLALALAPAAGFAQEAYPNHPIRLLVGFQAGASADVSARIAAQKMGTLLGQAVVVENRPGASSNIAAKAVIAAPADGYTLYVCTVANVINTAAKGNATVDIARETLPLARLGAIPNILVLNPSLGVDTLPAFIALLKAKPGQIAYATAGTGTALHMAAALFSQMAGVQMLHVPYQGSAAAVTDLLGGQTQVMFAPASTVLPHVKTGKLKAIASTGAQRTSAAPELPTLDELGMKGFESVVWVGITGPTGLPPAVVKAIETAAQSAVGAADVQSQFKAQGIEPGAQDHTGFAGYVRSETEKWTRVIQSAGIKLD